MSYQGDPSYAPDPDLILGHARRGVEEWEQAEDNTAAHEAAERMTAAFAALDDWLSHGGRLPAAWNKMGTALRFSPPLDPEAVAAIQQATADLFPGEDERTRMWRDLVEDKGIGTANREWPQLDPEHGGPGYLRGENKA